MWPDERSVRTKEAIKRGLALLLFVVPILHQPPHIHLLFMVVKGFLPLLCNDINLQVMWIKHDIQAMDR